MNFIDKVLLQLEATEWHPSEDAIDNYAEKHNVSWGHAEKALIKAHKSEEKTKEKERKAAEPKPKKERKPDTTPAHLKGGEATLKARLDKIARTAGKEWKADNDDSEMTIDQVAPDLADSLWYDNRVKDIANKLGWSKTRLVNYLMDAIP